MSDQPTTREEAIEQAAEWGKTRSHWNYYCGSMGVENRAVEMTLCAIHDTQEALRLLALAPLLPSRGSEYALPFDAEVNQSLDHLRAAGESLIATAKEQA